MDGRHTFCPFAVSFLALARFYDRIKLLLHLARPHNISQE